MRTSIAEQAKWKIIASPAPRKNVGTDQLNRISAISRRSTAGVSDVGRGILLWLLGVPIPVLIVLYLFHVI
jgi:hypothetical protein